MTTGSVTANNGPSVKHFYSHATSISFELPIRYAAATKDDSSASYVDNSVDPPVVVQTRVVARVGSEIPGKAVSALADGFADQPDTTILESRDAMIDGAPASTVVSRRADGWTIHQTALSGQGELLSVVAMIPPGAPTGTRAAIDAAIESIRVVRLLSQ